MPDDTNPVFPSPDVSPGGSGVRSEIDDGPGGQTTGDPSAGELGGGGPFGGIDEVDGLLGESGNVLEDLTIVSADDPSLGLTNYGDVPADDWAADTGPTRNPERGLSTDSQTDRGSTLAPDKD
jgi:hypothetical protein